LNHPRVSVIIPVYNGESFLAEAIKKFSGRSNQMRLRSGIQKSGMSCNLMMDSKVQQRSHRQKV